MTARLNGTIALVPNLSQDTAPTNGTKRPVDEYREYFQYKSENPSAEVKDYKYSHLLPTFPLLTWDPLPSDIPVFDPGHAAKARGGVPFANRPEAVLSELSSSIGTEVTGIDLSTLTDFEKADLALLVAERGVVLVRDQTNFDERKQLDFCRSYGPLYKHASGAIPEDPSLHEIHVVYRPPGGKRPPASAFSPIDLWHADVSYEEQPPGFTSFKLLTVPPVGGEGHFASGYAAYDALSPALQKYCEALYACYSIVGPVKPLYHHQRRPPKDVIHPIVRVHPVTAWKSLYVDPTHTRYIVGVPKAESEMLLNYLFNLIATSTYGQTHFKYTRDAVVLFDNRCVIHSSPINYYPHRRHAIRIMSVGEKPISVQDAIDREGIQPKSQFEDLLANGRIPP